MYRVASLFANADASYRADLNRNVRWGFAALAMLAAFTLPFVRF